MARLLIHFARYGPYHHARLRSAEEALRPMGWEVLGLETSGTDVTYAWDQTRETDGPLVVTAFPGRVHEEITANECKRVLHPLLDELKPDVIAIAGWASPDALACLRWCRKNDKRRIVMSETREADGKRVWWKELVKRYLIAGFEGAIVGGKSQRDYLVKLGMPRDQIRLGYNVVDNAYFAAGAAKWKKRCTGSTDGRSLFADHPPPYFLASNRFIERKNLSRLIEAYARYCAGAETTVIGGLWNLCLLGDGELKAELIAQCRAHGLHVAECAPWELRNTENLKLETSPERTTVFFPGFRQIEELPRFYSHAGCFVHPALEEPWGLVINEAMACGLAVLSSSNVGAAEELVDEGDNGWCFDATDVDAITECLCKGAGDDVQRLLVSASSQQILEERYPSGAFGKGLAALLQGKGEIPPGVWQVR